MEGMETEGNLAVLASDAPCHPNMSVLFTPHTLPTPFFPKGGKPKVLITHCTKPKARVSGLFLFSPPDFSGVFLMLVTCKLKDKLFALATHPIFDGPMA